MARTSPWRVLTLSLAVVLATVATAELGVRRLAKGLDDETIASTRLAFRQFDPVLGWANRPHASGIRRTSEFSYSVRVNADGMRGPELTHARKRDHRVAVLGDIFTWGWGVAEEDAFPTRLAQLLPSTEVLNFGVVGHGPVQHLLQVDRVSSFEPDLVVVAFCLGNDFADTVLYRRYGFFKPYARLGHDGRLDVAGYPLPEVHGYPTVLEAGSILRTLQARSHLFRLFERATLTVRSALVDPPQQGVPISESQHEIYLTAPSDTARQTTTITARVLKEIAARFAARHIPVVFVAVPTKCDLGVCFPEPQHDRGGALRALRAALHNVQAPLIDASPGIDLADYWQRDAHWRPSGHEKMAHALALAIVARLGE